MTSINKFGFPNNKLLFLDRISNPKYDITPSEMGAFTWIYVCICYDHPIAEQDEHQHSVLSHQFENLCD